jgi:hypothetical protein
MNNKGLSTSEFFKQGLQGLGKQLEEILLKTRCDPSLLQKITSIMGNENLSDLEMERLLKEISQPQYGEEMTEDTLDKLLESFRKDD